MIAKYELTAIGVTPLLMHADDVDWADKMEAWKNEPSNAKLSKPGDDRTPAWRWFGSLWHDGRNVVVPQDALGSCFMRAGAMVPVPGGKNGKTFKAQTQSGIQFDQPSATLLLGNGKPLKMSDIEPMLDESSFQRHREMAAALGFSLSVKRAAVGSSKHIRVRPRFDSWSFVTTVTVIDEQLTAKAMADIANAAGTLIGIGDWRPSSPRRPGPYGRFLMEVKGL